MHADTQQEEIDLISHKCYLNAALSFSSSNLMQKREHTDVQMF